MGSLFRMLISVMVAIKIEVPEYVNIPMVETDYQQQFRVKRRKFLRDFVRFCAFLIICVLTLTYNNFISLKPLLHLSVCFHKPASECITLTCFIYSHHMFMLLCVKVVLFCLLN